MSLANMIYFSTLSSLKEHCLRSLPLWFQ